MNWNKFIAQFPRGGKIFLEYGKLRMVEVVENEGSITLRYRTEAVDRLSPPALKLLPAMIESTANAFEILVTGRVLADGPKVFSPGQVELELLEEMALNIAMSDYVQPFETVIIELPENYIRNKTIDCPQAGEVKCGEVMPERHHPVLCILHHRKDFNCVVAMVVMSSMQSIKMILAPKPDEELDGYLAGIPTASSTFQNSEESSLAEMQAAEQVIRACMNYCLLLDEVGVRQSGANNMSYRERLQRYVEVARRRDDADRLERAKDELLMCPMHFELKQRVRLYRSVRTEQELPEATGRHKGPHRRRGHYRFQAHGPKYSLRKRIRIPPVFVNKQFFLGDESDAEVHYE